MLCGAVLCCVVLWVGFLAWCGDVACVLRGCWCLLSSVGLLSGPISGSNVLQIINESIAEGQKVIHDMDGCTFDVSLLTVFEMKAMAGDTHLGRENCRLLHAGFQAKNSVKDSTGSHRDIRCLKTGCERAKQATIDSDFILSLCKAPYEELKMDYLQRSTGRVEKCIRDEGNETSRFWSHTKSHHADPIDHNITVP